MPKLSFEIVIDGNTLPRQVNPVQSGLDMLATIEGSDHVNFTAVVGGWWRPRPFPGVRVLSQVAPVNIVTKTHPSVEPVFPVKDRDQARARYSMARPTTSRWA